MAYALMGIGGAAIALGAVTSTFTAGVFGVLGVATGVFQWRMGIAAQNANAAAAAINRGDMAEARELVAFVRGRHRLGQGREGPARRPAGAEGRMNGRRLARRRVTSCTSAARAPA